ncbi:MAG: hypothetical protein HY261_11300 [Chloroflexi bacterium]|nr:hypothetical protein [Chloroflexota bacterium]
MTTKKPIPHFKSYEEEAEFWDTHDLTDYFTFRPVRLEKGVTVRLDSPTLNAVNRQARDKGIGPSTLIRMWVKERVKADRPKERAGSPRRKRRVAS